MQPFLFSLVLFQGQRARVQRVARSARERCRNFHGAAYRQFLQQHAEQRVVIVFAFGIDGRAFDDQHEFAALPVGIFGEPPRPFGQGAAMQRLM